MEIFVDWGQYGTCCASSIVILEKFSWKRCMLDFLQNLKNDTYDPTIPIDCESKYKFCNHFKTVSIGNIVETVITFENCIASI